MVLCLPGRKSRVAQRSGAVFGCPEVICGADDISGVLMDNCIHCSVFEYGGAGYNQGFSSNHGLFCDTLHLTSTAPGSVPLRCEERLHSFVLQRPPFVGGIAS